jgi:hypothetical protein
VNGPRLTEERLRNHLDGDQPGRERMCLALLPLLGPFTECRPRRPKGGPDQARDIECRCQGVPTWGAVGFRNGGGNDKAARSATQKKFRDDLKAALKKNLNLNGFVFFTNVDLTPEQKAALIAHAKDKGVTAQVFDMEILRQALDSKDGIHIREQYLGINANADADEWKRLQTSKIGSYFVPIRLPEVPDGQVTDEGLEKLQDTLARILTYSFGHVCVTSPFDDFVFILSVEREDTETEPGFVPLTLAVHCHITAFVWAFQEWCQVLIEGSADRPSARMRSLPGRQAIDIQIQFGEFVPVRIWRAGTQISIHHVLGPKPPMKRKVTTSTLLRFLGWVINSPVLIWDDADDCPDLEKILNMMGDINDGGHFRWDYFHVNRNKPESWKYIGQR